jgi:Kef-type K+ transport system membrane component KefB/Trk K+ transport system NAD-binding subunit
MHPEEISFVPLLIVVVLAAAVPLLLGRFRKLRLPVVVGEIIAGLIVGKSLLGWVGEDPWLEFLSILGFAYLMFLSGLEVDFETVAKQARRLGRGHPLEGALPLAGLSFLLTLSASLGISFLLVQVGWISTPWFMALVLSTTSLGLVVPVLKERQILSTPYGQALLLGALIADFATMLMISLYAALATKGLTLDVLLVLLLLGLFLTIYRIARLLRRRVPQPLLQLEEWLATRTAQVPLRIAFAIGLVFIALAEVLGIEVILGAFLGGAIISLVSPEEGSELREKLDAFGYGFFIPIFFIHVGSQLDLGLLAESPAALILVPVLILTAYVVKMIPGLLYRFSYGWRKTIGAGVLLSARLSLIIAAAAIGLDLELISPAVNAAIVLVAAITCTLSPLVFEQIVPSSPPARRYGVVIVGADEIGLSLAEKLSLHGEPVTVVDASADRCRKARVLGADIVCDDARRRETLKEAGLEQARVMVSILRDVDRSLEICQLAQEHFEPPTIVAWLEDAAKRPIFQELGVRTIIPSLATMEALANIVRYPDAYLFLSDLEEEGSRTVQECTLRHKNWEGQPLHRIPLPEAVLILAIRRGSEIVVPRGSTILHQGDIVTLMGEPSAVDRAREACEA